MVVRLTRARRATSSRATRRKPWRSNSTTAASRMAARVGSAPGIALEGITVVAQPHWQMIPHPVHRPRAPARCEAPVATLLALAPRKAEKRTCPRRQAPGRQDRSHRIEHERDDAPQRRRDAIRTRETLRHIADAVLGGRVRDDDLVHHTVPVPFELGVIRG